MPKMQKQSYSSNNCPAFVAAYNLCDQRFVFGAVYVDSRHGPLLDFVKAAI